MGVKAEKGADSYMYTTEYRRKDSFQPIYTWKGEDGVSGQFTVYWVNDRFCRSANGEDPVKPKVIGEGKDARTEHVEISYTYDINNPTYSRYEPIHKPQSGQPEVQPMNRLIRVLRDRRGESMVEILVSTVVFMLLLGALNGAVGFASNAQRNSEQLRRERPNCRKACAEMQKSRTAKLPRTI